MAGFLFVLLFSILFCLAQESTYTVSNYSFISFQYDFGRTSPANTYFPETKPFQGIEVAFGRTNNRNDLAWVRQLNYPRSGISDSHSDFRNKEKIGSAISVIPFLDFPVFRKWSNRFDANIGIGASYFVHLKRGDKKKRLFSQPLFAIFILRIIVILNLNFL